MDRGVWFGAGEIRWCLALCNKSTEGENIFARPVPVGTIEYAPKIAASTVDPAGAHESAGKICDTANT